MYNISIHNQLQMIKASLSKNSRGSVGEQPQEIIRKYHTQPNVSV